MKWNLIVEAAAYLFTSIMLVLNFWCAIKNANAISSRVDINLFVSTNFQVVLVGLATLGFLVGLYFRLKPHLR